MADKPQTLANHVRWDPPFHFFVLPVTLASLIMVAVQFLRFPSWHAGWFVVMGIAACVAVTKIRLYALSVQDRVIRLEERLRLQSVLKEPLRSRIGELADTQFVGLRFAPDDELPGLVHRALDEKLGRKDIKQAIVKWRPDNSRI